MQVIRTIVWVVLFIALLLFSLSNWTTVEVRLWSGLVLETKLPALVLISFLLGVVPMWLLHLASKWRLNRRINALETIARQPSPALTATQLDAAAAADSDPETTRD